MATERKIRKELVRRADLLETQGLGEQAASIVAKGAPPVIRCWDYSDIRPIENPLRDLRTLRSLLRLQECHPEAMPYYLFDYHWREANELDEDDPYTDEVSILYLDADESTWEAERERLAEGAPRYFAVRFVDEDLVDGDGDCLDCEGSLAVWHAGIGDVLEITFEDEL